MTDTAPRRRSPSYGMVWRWHFYAGLFCVPFVLWLALTGSIYLFRPQIEAWLDRPYANVAGQGPRASAAAQAAAAVAAVPGSVLHRYQLPDTPQQAVQVLVGVGAKETRVYVHPQTLAILKAVDEDSRPMRIVFRLHGELLAGKWGSYLVELAASWTIVMILTGLFLWWPRGRRLAGTLWPRLGGRGRPFWRDLHAVTGLWISLFALTLLVSGLPWAKSWGGYLKAVRAVAEGQAPKQDWTTSRADELRARAASDAGTRAMLGDHAEHRGITMAHPVVAYRPLDRLVAAVRPLNLAAPVLISAPAGMSAPWTAKSDAANRPQRVDLTLDGDTGQILSRKDFAQRRLIDRIVGYGVAAHEGQLFGIANQLLNLSTALGLIMMAVSSIVMWWRRRPQGKLGAPPQITLHGGVALVVLIVAMGLALPLFGMSLLAVLAVERLALRRSGRLGDWLGLSHRQSA